MAQTLVSFLVCKPLMGWQVRAAAQLRRLRQMSVLLGLHALLHEGGS